MRNADIQNPGVDRMSEMSSILCIPLYQERSGWILSMLLMPLMQNDPSVLDASDARDPTDSTLYGAGRDSSLRSG